MPGSLIAHELEEHIQTCREQQFTGIVKVSGQTNVHWYIYYLLGRIVWTKSRLHSLRRWHRHLSIHSPVFCEQITQPVSLSYESWNYTALARLVKLKQFRRDQFSKVVESCITEDLFDILHIGTLYHEKLGQVLTYDTRPQEATALPFIMLQQERAWQQAQQLWQAWQQAGLAKYSPDWAPKISNLELLKLQTPPQTFQTLTTFIDGQTTLRDLALKFQQPLVPLTQSILPYVSRRMLGLIEVGDLVENAHDGFNPEAVRNQGLPIAQGAPLSNQPAVTSQIGPPLDRFTTPAAEPIVVPPVGAGNVASPPAPSPVPQPRNTGPMIIYIDDSPADSKTMGGIVESHGYQYRNIPDPLQALPMLLELKPKLIFLDLVMPIANGYEVCAQIRRISAFKSIPVIIVTSNDGIADRVRARVVGASGFLGKPIQEKKVLKVLKKHLRYTGSDGPFNPQRSALSPL